MTIDELTNKIHETQMKLWEQYNELKTTAGAESFQPEDIIIANAIGAAFARRIRGCPAKQCSR